MSSITDICITGISNISYQRLINSCNYGILHRDRVRIFVQTKNLIMTTISDKKTKTIARLVFVAMFISVVIAALFSFTLYKKINEEFLKQLGITKTDANSKITNSILGGYLDEYGVRNAKNIAIGNRTAVTKNLLAYTKQYVNAPAFAKEYTTLRENQKPKLISVQTPEDMQEQMIAQSKKGIADLEASIKKADAANKKIFEDVLLSAKKQLQDFEDPNNKGVANYRKNYPSIVKSTEANNQKLLADWEKQYPVNHHLFIKGRLLQFLDETKDIDYSAELITKNGKKYFVNKAYESKGNRWKMAFRSGKEVVEPAREFVQQWILEIGN